MRTRLPGKAGIILFAGILCLVGSSQAGCFAPPANLVAWWAGESAPNDVGGTNNAVMSIGVQFVAGEVGTAFSFDGASYLATPVDAQPSAMPNTTWEAWVYPTLLSGRRQLICDDDGGYDRSLLLQDSSFGVFTGSGVWTPTNAVANQWQHVAVVYSTTNIELYVNGARFAFGSPATGGATGQPLQIARNPGNAQEYFVGYMDEISIYNRVLSAAEIQSIYAAGSAGKCQGAQPASDLRLGLAASTNSVNLNNSFSYVLSITNNGPNIATNVTVVDPLSGNVTFVSANSSIGTSANNSGTITFSIPSLAVGAVAACIINVSGYSAGTVTNMAWSYSLENDPVAANNRATNVVVINNVHLDAPNGNWADETEFLTNTPEAAVMIRTGDIDNLGFGWPAGYDPFSGNSTPVHLYPWATNAVDPAGTDRIMVISSYNGHPPAGQDGYTSGTSRPGNAVQPITLVNPMTNLTVSAAAFQIFVDDFQAPVWGANYQVTINGVRAPFLETVVNALNQTGPIGKLITVQVPSNFLNLVSSTNIVLVFDDFTTGAGDGYAIDFVKLLLNPAGFAQTGTITGTVMDSVTAAPLTNVLISAGGTIQTQTTNGGQYTLTNVPAGLAFITASLAGYSNQLKSIDLVAGQTTNLSFSMNVLPILVPLLSNNTAVIRWPSQLSNWVLQSTPALAADGTAHWTTVTNAQHSVGSQVEVDIPLTTNGNIFFRRHSP